MKILLIGKTGQLGGNILRNGAGHEIHAHDETTLDITAPEAVRAAIADLRPGVYHLVNEGACTWYEFTKEIYRILGLSVEVRPVDRKGLTGAMRRPLYSALANTKAKALGIVLPHWRDGLTAYLAPKGALRP